MSLPLVVLFKAPETSEDDAARSDDSEPNSPLAGDQGIHADPYDRGIREQGMEPFFVPVLEERTVNQEVLDHLLKEEAPHDHWSGVIITSSRAAKAWSASARRLASKLSSENYTEISAAWAEIPFFVVGSKTGRILSDQEAYPASAANWRPRRILGEEETGTGPRLAEFIVSYFTSLFPGLGADAASESARAARSSSPGKSSLPLPLLYLSGDKSTGQMQAILDGAGLPPHRVQVYETWSREDFSEDLARLTSSIQTPNRDPSTLATQRETDTSTRPIWLVFLAPSAAKAVLPALEGIFNLESLASLEPRVHDEATGHDRLLRAKVAAIGPTTGSFLTNEMSLRVHVVSPKPTARVLAAELSDAIRRC